MDRHEMEGNLGPMRDLDDYEIADHEPDPRGWRVLSSDGRQIGDVDDLIVDTNQMKVRYLDCDLDESGLNLSGADRNRHILVPIEHARFNETNRQITVQGMNADDLLSLPAYAGGALTAGLASQVSRFFSGRSTTDDTLQTAERRTHLETERPELRRDVDEERVTRSEEEMAVGKRMVDAGEVNIHKTVETEHVRQPVTRRHEEVDIERHPVSGKSGRIIDQDEDIRIPLREEEVVVEKRPELKEELVVRKRELEEEVEVEADLRKERIDIERQGRTPGERGGLFRESDEEEEL